MILITHDLGIVAGDPAIRWPSSYAGLVVEYAEVSRFTHNPAIHIQRACLIPFRNWIMEGGLAEEIHGLPPNLQRGIDGPFNPRCPNCMEICSIKSRKLQL